MISEIPTNPQLSFTNNHRTFCKVENLLPPIINHSINPTSPFKIFITGVDLCEIGRDSAK